jgi:parallel beta-helix repeat protein
MQNPWNTYRSLWITTSTGIPRDITIKNNSITSPIGGGVHCTGVFNLTLDGNNIETKDYCIQIDELYDGNLTLSNNELNSKTGVGIEVYSTHDGSGSEIPEIIDNTIKQAGLHGIIATNCPNIRVEGNEISNTGDDGITLVNSSNARIIQNIISNVNTSISMGAGINITDCNNTVIEGNEITSCGGDGIHYRSTVNGNNVNISLNTISFTGADGIDIMRLINGRISENTINFFRYRGIYIRYGDEIEVQNNIITQSTNEDGIDIQYSTKISIKSCLISDMYSTGIELTDSDHVDIQETVISNCNEGIYLLTNAHNNTIRHNFITDCFYGLEISGDENNLYNNTILENMRGVYLLSGSADNFLFFNNFINNKLYQAYDTGTDNKWSVHEAIPSDYYLGNYWSDYEGIDIVAPTGFGDTPYNVTGNIIDEYPLISEVTTTLPPPTINHPLDLTFITETTGHVLAWSVSSTVNPSHYIITIDGVSGSTTVWDGFIISISVDGLLVGSHTVICTVYDKLGQSTSDTVMVIVTTETGATTTPPANQTTTTTGGDSPDMPIDLPSSLIGAVGGITLMGILFLLLKIIRRK